MSKPGRLVILSGPSGVGKDTVINAWALRNPRVQRVVSYTTRSPRTGEVDGTDYNFVSPERFQELVNEGAFLEHKLVHGNYYATPLRDMERMLADGIAAVLKIDVQGALTAMKLRPDALTIFLLPPSFEVLEARIRDRGTDDEPTILKRLENAKMELATAEHYQHRIVNESVEEVVRQLEELVAC